MKLKFAIPVGSLEKQTIELFRKAGIKIWGDERSYFPACSDEDLQIFRIRAQEIPIYVEEGVVDAGITGYDWITEMAADVYEVGELKYAKSGFRPVRWVLAVPENSNLQKLEDLNGKTISTEVVNIVKNFFKKNKINATVEFSWGATEAKAGVLADAIVELTETGTSLKANKLKEIATVFVSTTRFIANKKSIKDSWKKQKINSIYLLLKSAVDAEGMVGIKLNIEKKNLEKALKLLPALKKPTVAELADKDWVAVETILKEEEVVKLIPKLKAVGASGIVEYPLNKIIY
ncbi:MAG: ATP phosphoribosyltransferase [bacterium]|nr:ATP phosphoribosyltransferase [bacterium]